MLKIFQTSFFYQFFVLASLFGSAIDLKTNVFIGAIGKHPFFDLVLVDSYNRTTVRGTFQQNRTQCFHW